MLIISVNVPTTSISLIWQLLTVTQPQLLAEFLALGRLGKYCESSNKNAAILKEREEGLRIKTSRVKYARPHICANSYIRTYMYIFVRSLTRAIQK